MKTLVEKVREMRLIQFRYERAARLGYAKEVVELLKQKVAIESEVDTLIKMDDKPKTNNQSSIF